MTTKKNMKLVLYFSTVFLLLATVIGCSNDDDADPTLSIYAQEQTYTVNGVNNCNTSSGGGSTFVFEIPYISKTNSAIDKLQIKTTVSDGGSDVADNTIFTDEDDIVGWATCFRFGSQDWVEFEVVLVTEDGSKSNPSTVRVNRPSGAS